MCQTEMKRGLVLGLNLCKVFNIPRLVTNWVWIAYVGLPTCPINKSILNSGFMVDKDIQNQYIFGYFRYGLPVPHTK